MPLEARTPIDSGAAFHLQGEAIQRTQGHDERTDWFMLATTFAANLQERGFTKLAKRVLQARDTSAMCFMGHDGQDVKNRIEMVQAATTTRQNPMLVDDAAQP
jgi:hypothetical protein